MHPHSSKGTSSCQARHSHTIPACNAACGCLRSVHRGLWPAWRPRTSTSTCSCSKIKQRLRFEAPITWSSDDMTEVFRAYHTGTIAWGVGILRTSHRTQSDILSAPQKAMSTLLHSSSALRCSGAIVTAQHNTQLFSADVCHRLRETGKSHARARGLAWPLADCRQLLWAFKKPSPYT